MSYLLWCSLDMFSSKGREGKGVTSDKSVRSLSGAYELGELLGVVNTSL